MCWSAQQVVVNRAQAFCRVSRQGKDHSVGKEISLELWPPFWVWSETPASSTWIDLNVLQLQAAVFNHRYSSVWQCVRVSVHRSNSSLGNFLLMTASSLFENIWREHRKSTVSRGLGSMSLNTRHPIPPRSDGIEYVHCDSQAQGQYQYTGINNCNCISWHRFNVKDNKQTGERGARQIPDGIICLSQQDFDGV